MQFKYSFQSTFGDKVPMVQVRITNKDNGKSTSYWAMLDSGAYANVFHSDIAEVLGIDLKNIKDKQLFGGVKESKKMSGRGYVCELMIMQKGKSRKFDSYIVFSDEISNTGYGLLGRQGFFDQFSEICFSYKNNKFYLQKDQLDTSYLTNSEIKKGYSEAMTKKHGKQLP